ncbi:MAG: FumA C-terminus/TtdB family hydratase beta subunit [Fervidobacterium sp.]|uniref:FumA C-terminus/TtdB family hydratase beta subunit n=1 Tax=Fervidobacterium sp. TaxID=1871331 RepID=UPI00309ADF6A
MSQKVEFIYSGNADEGRKFLCNLPAGTEINYIGKFYAMRDAAHKRLVEMEKNGEQLPIDLSGKIIFYAGPTFVGSRMIIGPTTSKRMDRFFEFTTQKGILATVGKGVRTQEVIKAIEKYKVPYLVAPSGCAAYLSEKIIDWRIVVFEDLGPEAIYEITVKDFPMILLTDCCGRSL